MRAPLTEFQRRMRDLGRCIWCGARATLQRHECAECRRASRSIDSSPSLITRLEDIK